MDAALLGAFPLALDAAQRLRPGRLGPSRLPSRRPNSGTSLVCDAPACRSSLSDSCGEGTSSRLTTSSPLARDPPCFKPGHALSSPSTPAARSFRSSVAAPPSQIEQAQAHDAAWRQRGLWTAEKSLCSSLFSGVAVVVVPERPDQRNGIEVLDRLGGDELRVRVEARSRARRTREGGEGRTVPGSGPARGAKLECSNARDPCS